MPGILKHKITFDYETSQLHSGTIICPSRQSGRLGLLLLALLLEAQRYYRHCAVLSRYEEFSDLLTRVREQLGRNFRSVNTRIARAAACLCINSARRIFARLYARARLPGVFRRLCARKRVKSNLSDGVNRGLTALKIGKVVYKLCVNEKQISHLPVCKWLIFKWAQRGMIPRPSDYESAALTN